MPPTPYMVWEMLREAKADFDQHTYSLYGHRGRRSDAVKVHRHVHKPIHDGVCMPGAMNTCRRFTELTIGEYNAALEAGLVVSKEQSVLTVNIAEQKTSASACRICPDEYWMKMFDTYSSCTRSTIYKETGITGSSPSTAANRTRRSPMASISYRKNTSVPNSRQELLG
ncbi:hypothetical protein DPMN_050704 [Dreissena polymorpha]|uniref:Uncharacterized protein n=1 Tax=Dreissena polymorpha TaxID=45954 RepID=A0A9D4CH98_DREPO|nr:hypothetical protein DPMN_050704 [Dreissena polymorpha]